MKLYIERYSKGSTRTDGKTLFCNRLGDALEDEGILVTGDPEQDVDVSLNVVHVKHQNSPMKVLRLNGVCFDLDKNYRAKNQKMICALCRADKVVYQSQFARQMCDQFLGEFDGPSRVILNGAPCVQADVERGRDFVAAARWRRFKRLEETIDSFLLAGLNDSKLYVAGGLEKSGVNPDKYKSCSNVVFLGHVDQKGLKRYLSRAAGFLHLSWFDACPNGVVEAVALGVPVICGNVGGTKEVVGPSGGFVCDIDEPYDFTPVRVYDPPSIDLGIVADAIHRCVDGCCVSNGHIDICDVADQYRRFMFDE